MHGKSILSILLVFVLMSSLSLISTASVNDNSVITVTVPSEHTVTVICGVGGSVKVGQSEYTGTNSFTVKRHSDFTLSASPNTGYELVSITGSNIHEMSFEGSSATLKKVSKDTEFTVLFRAKEHQNVPVDILIPVTSENDRIAAGAEIIGDKASIMPEKTEFDEFLNNNSGIDTVSVGLSHLGVNINTVIIPASTVRAMVERADTETEDSPGMNVILPSSKITFDSAALTAIAEQAQDDELALHVETIDEGKLTTAQQAAIADVYNHELIVTIALKSGDLDIHDFQGGSIDVELPYTPREDENTETITVWYVAENGIMEKIPCRYKNGFVLFTVSHFSDYIIVPGTTPDKVNHCFICALVGHHINPWCWLIPTLVIGAVFIVVLTVLMIRRVKKHSTKLRNSMSDN